MEYIQISIWFTIIVAFHFFYIPLCLYIVKQGYNGGTSTESFIGGAIAFCSCVVGYIIWWLLYCSFRYLTGL